MNKLFDKNLIDKNIIYMIVCIVILVGYGTFGFIVPQIGQISSTKAQISKVKSQIEDLQVKQAKLKAPQEQLNEQEGLLPVKIYTSPYKGLDIESASVDLVYDLVQELKNTKNKVTSVSFSSSKDGNIGVLAIDMTLSTNYISLQNFLKAVVSWKYLVGIKSISIEQKEDPMNLSAELKLDLYVNE